MLDGNVHDFFLGVGGMFFVFRVGVYAVIAISSNRLFLFDYSSSVYSFDTLVLDARNLFNVSPVDTGEVEIKGNFQEKIFKN